jgi:hypothetical protein
MKPFEKYAFQRAKNVFNDRAESVEKWAKPVLDSGACLLITPVIAGERAALHKRGPDFLLQIEGSDDNFAKELPEITEDFKNYDHDFVVEGVVNEGIFMMTDILFYGSEDLVDKVLHERHAILTKAFGDLSGYNSDILRSFVIETIDQFEETAKSLKHFNAGIDTSLYTEGCPSNQWCQVTPVVEEIAKNFDGAGWDEKLEAGISGEFTVSVDKNSQHIVQFTPIRPWKSQMDTAITFENVDKSSGLKRQFQKGSQFTLGFQKLRSPNPDSETEYLDFGTFTVLKSANQSTVIDFDGFNNVFKGIFHVDCVQKHNIKPTPDVSTDHVYQLRYSDANLEIEKRFGDLVWYDDKTVQKSMVPIYKQDAEKEEQFVFGEVLIPNEIDAHGDIYSAAEVRFAAHFFMEKFGNTGLMHEQFINDDAVIVETFVAPASMTIEGRKVKKGTWLIGMRILNEKLFGDIKAGRLTGFSIGGVATVQELKKLMDHYAVAA